MSHKASVWLCIVQFWGRRVNCSSGPLSITQRFGERSVAWQRGRARTRLAGNIHGYHPSSEILQFTFIPTGLTPSKSSKLIKTEYSILNKLAVYMERLYCFRTRAVVSVVCFSCSPEAVNLMMRGATLALDIFRFSYMKGSQKDAWASLGPPRWLVDIPCYIIHTLKTTKIL